MDRTTAISAACAAIACVAAAVAIRQGGGEGVPPAAAPRAHAPTERGGLEQQITRLRDQLELESQQRMLLAQELAALGRTVRARVGQTNGFDERESPVLEERARPPEPDPSQARAGLGPDPERLVAAGFSTQEVEAFRTRFDELALEQLYRRDRALRGDAGETADAPALDTGETLRSEFGDALYDWALYSMGRPNRVRIAGVMSGSAAALEGLEAGDVIVRYADEPVFALTDLREGTTGGAAGEPTWVEVERGGELIRVSLPRGPLGVRVEPTTRQPPPPT